MAAKIAEITLFKRAGTAKWQAKIKLPGQERIRISTGSTCRDTAQEIADAEAQKAWNRRANGHKQTVSFAEAAVAYVQDGGDDRFLDPLIKRFGEREVGSILPAEIRQAALDFHDGCRPDTLNRQVITPARAVVLFAHDQGWCPAIRVRGFTEDRLRKLGRHFEKSRQTVAVDWDWIDRFRANASNRYLAALALFMFTTGSRVGSAIRMDANSIDLPNGRATIPPTKEHPELEVLLVPEMVADLATLKPRRGKVFGYACRHSVYGPWRTTCERAGIPYVPPHQAGRHSFATEAVTRQGVDAKTAMDMGGWKSSRLFNETYVHGEGHHEVALAVFGRTRVAK